ncbi:MAG: AMP-binding protein, partial [Planctomycetota bacterium]
MSKISYHHRCGEQPLLGMPIHVKFEEIAAQFPDREAVVSLHQNRRLTYSQLRTEVDRLAKGLLALGIGRGERVGIWAVDNVEWILVQLATAKIGAVLVNVNPANKFRDLEHVLSSAGLRTLIYMPAFRKSNYAAMVD